MNDKVLLSVIVTIANIGDVLIQLEKCQIRLSQVLPPKGDLSKLLTSLETRPGVTATPNVSELSVKSWFQIDYWRETWEPKLKVEPGESRQVDAHFVIEPAIETVLLYSHITNVRERNRILDVSKNLLKKILALVRIKVKERGPELDLGWELNTLYDLQVARNGLSPNVVQSPNGAQTSWLKRWRRL